MNRLERGLLHWLQRRCAHPTLKADLAEGDDPYRFVMWCETCGAVKSGWVSDLNHGRPELRLPEPLWEDAR